MSDVGCLILDIEELNQTSDILHINQLPLDPPVLIGFLVTPTALAPGFAMNLEP